MLNLQKKVAKMEFDENGALIITTDKNDKQMARGGLLQGPSHAEGGIDTRFGELEGGEAVINKNSARMFKPLLSAINQAGGGIPFDGTPSPIPGVYGWGDFSLSDLNPVSYVKKKVKQAIDYTSDKAAKLKKEVIKAKDNLKDIVVSTVDKGKDFVIYKKPIGRGIRPSDALDFKYIHKK